MKKFRYYLLGLSLCCLAGCYEVNEEISIDSNGAGTYVTKMDMGQLVALMQNMSSAEDLAKTGIDRVVDTTINLRDALDTSAALTPEQKRLYNDGTMKLQLNAKENLMKADMKFPFHSYSDLQALMSGAGTRGLTQAFQKALSKDSTQPASPMQDQGMDQINNVFDVSVTKGSIVRKLNDAKYKALMERPEMTQLKQMMSSGMMGSNMEVQYTTTIKLPRPVKKFDNQLIKLSDDKKTVTIKYDIMKVLDTPEKFSYSIYY